MSANNAQGDGLCGAGVIGLAAREDMTAYQVDPVTQYIPESVTPGQLIRLVNQLADDVAKWRDALARYKAEKAEVDGAYKQARAEARFKHRDARPTSLINVLADMDSAVVVALQKQAELDGRVELAQGIYEGLLAQYQAVKQSISLRVEELRTFRG